MEEKKEQNISHWEHDGIFVQTVYSDSESGLLVKDGADMKIVPTYETKTGVILRPLDKIYLAVKQVIVPSNYEECAPEIVVAELKQFYLDNLFIDDETVVLLTGYTLFTWFFDKTHTAPYLYIQGDKGTAKSRILDLMSHTCFNAATLGVAVTEANIFRMQEIVRGTLMIDELEAEFKGKNNFFNQILNNGYKQDGVVMRIEKLPSGKSKPVPYIVYGPKIIASRTKPSDDALRSRCFYLCTTVQKLPVLRKHNIPLEFTDSARETALQLRNKLLGLRFGYYEKMPCSFEQSQSESLTPRAAQIIDSILSVVSEEWVPGLRVALENHLFEDGISAARRNERMVQNAISMLSLDADSDYASPLKIPFKSINDVILKTESYQLSSRDVGGIVKSLGLEAVRSKNGMYIVIRGVDDVADVGEIEPCATDDVEDVANVAE